MAPTLPACSLPLLCPPAHCLCSFARTLPGLFGAASRVKPAGASFDRIQQVLEVAGLFEGGQITLGCKTLIAPTDDVRTKQKVNWHYVNCTVGWHY